MKIANHIFKAGITVVAAAIMASCTHNFEEINTNPNTMVLGDLNPYGVFEATFYNFGKSHTSVAYTYCNELVQLLHARRLPPISTDITSLTPVWRTSGTHMDSLPLTPNT